MRKLVTSLSVVSQLFSLLLLASISPAAQAPDQRPPHVSDEIIVRFRDGTSESQKSLARSRIGAYRSRSFKIFEQLEVNKLPANVTVEEAIDTLRQDPDVLYAEPNYIVKTQVMPNDTRFGDLWGLNNTGQSGGTPDADIDAPEAWDISTGSSSVVVGIIDSGIDYNHQDLISNRWENPADCDNDNFDDDGNGYKNDCHGIDVVNNDSDPLDDNRHGTHVAGTIGASGNNNSGVTGINWTSSLAACKTFDASGNGTTADTIECINYFLDLKKNRGIPIVATNNSWGGGGFSQATYDAIKAHMNEGILFIAAAGNGDPFFGFPINNDQTPFYPCTYDLPNIICVAATTRTDGKASFSNYGRRTVHIGAPGYEILSTTLNNTYSYLNGTSMATPHVTGVVALLKAANPSWNWKDIKNRILAGSDDTAAMNGITITGKRLNANGALTCSNASLLSRLRPIPDVVIGSVGTPVNISVMNIKCDPPYEDVILTIDPLGTNLALSDDGSGLDLAAGDGIYSGQWSPPSTGNFYFKFQGTTILTVSVDSPTITVTPSSLDFGGVNVGAFLDKTLIVKNAGSGTLTGSASTNAPFSIVSGGSYSLSTGQSQNVTVRFAPTSAGTFLGNVNFTGGGDAAIPVSGTGVVPPNMTLSFDGKVKDRVGMGDKALTADGNIDGTLTVTLESGSGDRTVTSLDLKRSDNSSIRWNTTADSYWVLGAAGSPDGTLYNNTSDASVNFAVSDGGSFKLFGSDYNNQNFPEGAILVLTAKFADGSTGTASATIPSPPPPPPGPSLGLTFDGKLRDRVGKGDKAVTADGNMDGTLTVTLQAGSGDRTVTSLDLKRSDNTSIRWNTTADSYWVLGAAASLDGTLYNNTSDASVNFAVSDGGSFKLFASDNNNTHFPEGATLVLTANFADGSTASASVVIPAPPPPPPGPSISLSFDGKLRDRVGMGDKAFAADGNMDGTLTVTLQAGSGDRTVTSLDLKRSDNTSIRWNTTADTYWALGAAASLDGTLYNNTSDASVNFAVSDGGSFKLFASDNNNTHFPEGATLVLTANFADGSTASASTVIPAPPPPPPGPTISLSFDGKLRDRVGMGDKKLTADGKLDGTLTVTLQAGSGNRTVTALDLKRSDKTSIRWNTTVDKYWALGAAASLDATLYNNLNNVSVNFSLSEGQSFILFASDDNKNTNLAAGKTLVLTVSFADGSTTSANVTIPSP